MPIYDFLCRECGHEFTELVDSSVTNIPCCHECPGETAEKLVSGFGGYNGDTGPSSTSPKGSKSFKNKRIKRKFDKNGQLSFDFGDE